MFAQQLKNTVNSSQWHIEIGHQKNHTPPRRQRGNKLVYRTGTKYSAVEIFIMISNSQEFFSYLQATVAVSGTRFRIARVSNIDADRSAIIVISTALV